MSTKKILSPSESLFSRARPLPIVTLGLLLALQASAASTQGVPHGSKAKALTYYSSLSTFLEFRDPTTITNSTLDDVAAYLGYSGVGALDLQNLAPDVLMDPGRLAASVTNSAQFRATFNNRPLQSGEILSSRFFAPKIINVNDPPATRSLGWRKLVRLRARSASLAAKHKLDSAIILFNLFTEPGVKPFGPNAESVNTQVILTSVAPGQDSIYWLDYGRLPKETET